MQMGLKRLFLGRNRATFVTGVVRQEASFIVIVKIVIKRVSSIVVREKGQLLSDQTGVRCQSLRS